MSHSSVKQFSMKFSSRISHLKLFLLTFFSLLPPKVAALFGDTAKKQRDEKKTEIELKIVSNDSRRRVIKLNLKGRKKKERKIFRKEKFPFSLNNVDEKREKETTKREHVVGEEAADCWQASERIPSV